VLEADFMRYYNIDLVEESVNNTLSWRRFLLFIQALPPGSAYERWLSNNKNRQFAEWNGEIVDENINQVKRK